MQLDKNMVFCLGKTPATTAGASEYSDVVDMERHGDDIMRHLSLYVAVNGKSAMAGSGSALTVELESSDDEAFTSPKTEMTIANAAGPTSLTAGTRLVNYEPLKLGMKRYLRLKLTNGETAATTNATIDAFITDNRQIRPTAAEIG